MSSPTRRSFERSLSIASADSESSVDWDTALPTTPRNTVAFPPSSQSTATSSHPLPSTPSHVVTPSRNRTAPGTPSRRGLNTGSIGRDAGARTLSDILRKHADKEFAMDQEEATRVGDVLRGWINSSLSPYEGDDDDFNSFASKHKDDMAVPSASRRDASQGSWGRARGMSESVQMVAGSGSRPGSSAA